MITSTEQGRTPRTTPAANSRPPLPGSLALALINTEVIERGQRRDLLPSPEALVLWWARACARFPDECPSATAEPVAWTGDLVEEVKGLRAALRTLIMGVVERHTVEEADLVPLNAVLALGYPALERTARGAVQVVTRPRDDGQGRILVPIARSALRLFTELDWQRLHQCKSDRCVIFFYDTTKSATRRWCSPGCMNRARSIQHYQRIKQQPPSGG
ncbi:MAG TPA: ABATE domain-containing protein [Ktedonobacterales bacterium]